MLQQPPRHQQIHIVIFHQQYKPEKQAADTVFLVGGHRQRRRRLSAIEQAQGQGKGTAAALVAAHCQGATEHFTETAGDGQPQTGAAKATGGGRVDLRKGFEQIALAMLGNTDAGVAHRQGQVQPVITNLGGGDPQNHAPFLGEFHCIGDQVVKHLAQPGGITAHHFANQLTGIFQPQVQALAFCHVAKGGHTVFQQRQQFEKHRVQIHAPGFDAGKIENIVDHVQQVAGGFQRRQSVLVLLFALRGFFEQLQHAQHSVHGSAQLVTHHGQKITLGLAGGLRLTVSVAQFVDGALLLPMSPFQTSGQLVDIVLQLGQFPAQMTAAADPIIAIAQGA